MTRPSSAPTPQSWTIWWNHKGSPIVVPSHWQPGYTSGHSETKLGAIDQAIGKLEAHLSKTKKQLDLLRELKIKEKKQDETTSGN